MQKIIISDTSCLILLDKIGELNILKSLYGEVVVTQDIVDEYQQDIPDWIKIQNPKNKVYQKILETNLDKGESSAIALAIEQMDCLLILDDHKGRKYAEQLGIINYWNTGGINYCKTARSYKVNQTNFGQNQ